MIVDHEIRAGDDEVDFRVVATNPRPIESQAHWEQPCIRVDRFTGVKPEPNSEAYLPNGLIDAAKGKTRIVDGFEQSYGYRESAAFERAHETMTRKAATQMADPPAYGLVVSAGFGLWLDYDWRKRGWKTDMLESNYFSPERFHDALRAALDRSDEYVWIYSEQPRWWSDAGKPIDLPAAYVESVRKARKGLCQD